MRPRVRHRLHLVQARPRRLARLWPKRQGPPAPRRLRLRAALGSLALVCAALATSESPAGAQGSDPVPVTVTILRYVQIENPDTGDNGDYYGAVCWRRTCDLGDAPHIPDDQTAVSSNSTDIEPMATLTRTFDRSVASTITLQLMVWDFDPGFFNAPDDVMDINPTNNAVALRFSVNLNTGAWTEVSGAIPTDNGFARGDGDTGLGFTGPGGEAGRILFDISLSNDGDGDDDGIPDGMERTQLRDTNGTVVANFANLGADPCRKTIAVETDFMESQGVGHTHRPKPAALTEIRQAFANAPVPVRADCPYRGTPSPPFPSGTGANLVLQVDDPIPEQAVLRRRRRNAFSRVCTVSLPAIRDAAGFFNPARRPYFHYALWAHDLAPGITNSGIQCRQAPSGSSAPVGRDFIVSLGSWPDEFTSPVGTVRQQSATFMHELGHALGLGHGGVEGTTQTGNANITFKPNYLSVMNYLFAVTGIRDNVTNVFRIDYSRTKLRTLFETGLDETLGVRIGLPEDNDTAWFDPSGNLRRGPARGPVDWDFDGNPFETSVPADVNGGTRCISPGANTALETAPVAPTPSSPGDITVGTTIFNGPDGACQTIVPAGDDVLQVDSDRPCVATGGDDVLQTKPATGSDDLALKRSIGVGANRVCNTTAAASDFQATPVGSSETTVALTGFDDWAGLDYSNGLGGVAKPLFASAGTHADITYSEAQVLEAFWRDAATIPGVTVSPQEPLTGPVVAEFTEAVEGVTPDNVVLRRDGTAQPLSATPTCKDSSGGSVSCASRVVASVALRPHAPLVPGEHYRVSVNPAGVRPVTDPAGNAVASTQLPFRGSLDEPEGSVAAAYRWQQVTNSNAAGGSYTREHLKGATASVRFRGNAISWLTVTGPNQGLAKVFIDGALVQTLDQYAPTTSYRVPRTFGGLASGEHTITIEATGVKGNPAASNTFVSVDAFRVGEDLYENPDVEYRWQPSNAFEDVAAVDYVRTDLRGAQVAFTFRGTGVTLFTAEGPAQGKFEVLIDGQSAGVFDSYKATTKYGVPTTFGGLTDDLHTITLVVAGNAHPASSGTFVGVDGWSVK
jgi:hypothetical protein